MPSGITNKTYRMRCRWKSRCIDDRWRSTLDAIISARYDWSVTRPSTSFPLRHWNLRNLTVQTCLTLLTCLSITQDFFRLHSTFARLYNATALPASRLRSAGLVGNKWITIFREEASPSLLDFMRPCIKFKSEFGNVGVSGGRQTGESRKKPRSKMMVLSSMTRFSKVW